MPALREGTRKVEPLFSIVIVVAKEMLADKDSEPRTQRTRKQYSHEQDYSAKQETHLHDGAPTAAEKTEIVASAGHSQQISSSAKQCRRIKENAARYCNTG